MPRPKKLQNIISDQESDESQINENNEEEISISDKSQNTIIQRIEYRDLSAKSVFNFKNFKLEISNFERWYDALRRHLIAQDYQDYIDKELDYDNMTRTQIKYDNAVQSIIVDSLDIETQTLLRGCKTSYQMINILKQQYYKSGQDLINFLLQKIKNLKIKNNDYNLYLNELNTLFEQYDYECDKLKINSLDENTKLLYACTELLSSGFTAYNTYKYKTFKNLKEDLLQTYYHQKRMEDYMSTRNITFSVDDNNNNINQNNINKYKITKTLDQGNALKGDQKLYTQLIDNISEIKSNSDKNSEKNDKKGGEEPIKQKVTKTKKKSLKKYSTIKKNKNVTFAKKAINDSNKKRQNSSASIYSNNNNNNNSLNAFLPSENKIIKDNIIKKNEKTLFGKDKSKTFVKKIINKEDSKKDNLNKSQSRDYLNEFINQETGWRNKNSEDLRIKTLNKLKTDNIQRQKSDEKKDIISDNEEKTNNNCLII